MHRLLLGIRVRYSKSKSKIIHVIGECASAVLSVADGVRNARRGITECRMKEESSCCQAIIKI